MSERDGYAPGVPCWVASVHPDPEAAMRFYTELFGWGAEDAIQPGSPERYFVCTLRGRKVAAVGEEPGGGPPRVPDWGTHVWIESADDTATRVSDAGGRVIVPPYDLLDLARVAVVADPAGAVFCLWQPNEHRGAQVVNEPGAWSMSQLTTPDPEGAKDFYREVFGWATDSFDMDGIEITLWRVPGYEGGEPGQPVARDVVAAMAPMQGDPDEARAHWGIDLWVADVDATAAKAKELGGEIIDPPAESSAGFRRAVLTDPQGASFFVSKVG